MAGGPGAAGVPASSARSPPRPHALAGFRVGRAEGWRRGGGGRRRAAARSRVRPAYLGRGGAPEAAPPPGPGGGGSASLPRSGRPARLLCLNAKKGPAAARREAAAVLVRLVRAASAAEGIPAPSLQPPPTPRFSLPPAGPLPRARPASGSGFRGGLRAPALRLRPRPRSLPRTPGAAALRPAGSAATRGLGGGLEAR